MSRCISVISHARFNRHKHPKNLQTGELMPCLRCLQPAFVKPNVLDRIVTKAAKELGASAPGFLGDRTRRIEEAPEVE